MQRNQLYAGIGMGVAAAAGIAMLTKPRKNRQMKKAMKTVGQALGAVPGIMGW